MIRWLPWRVVLWCLLLTGCAQSCDKDAGTVPSGGGGNGVSCPPTSSLIGYGLIQHWEGQGAKLAPLLKDNCLTLTALEYVNDDLNAGPSAWSASAYRTFKNDVRAQGLTLLTILLNWNAEDVRAEPDAWFLDRLQEVIDVGIDGVILLPVNEPDASAKARRWEQFAKDRWPGLIAFNAEGGRGTPHFVGNYITWNWCEPFTASNIRPQPTINTLDCTPMVNASPDLLVALTQIALAARAHFLAYTFDTTPNVQKISAMGAQIKK